MPHMHRHVSALALIHTQPHRWQSQSLQGATQASSYGSSRLFPARRKHKAEAVKTIQEIKALDVSVPTLFNPHALDFRQMVEPRWWLH